MDYQLRVEKEGDKNYLVARKSHWKLGSALLFLSTLYLALPPLLLPSSLLTIELGVCLFVAMGVQANVAITMMSAHLRQPEMVEGIYIKAAAEEGPISYREKRIELDDDLEWEEELLKGVTNQTARGVYNLVSIATETTSEAFKEEKLEAQEELKTALESVYAKNEEFKEFRRIGEQKRLEAADRKRLKRARNKKKEIAV